MILDRFRLDGKVALITGGSRSLGLGMAAALAGAGALSSRSSIPLIAKHLQGVPHD